MTEAPPPRVRTRPEPEDDLDPFREELEELHGGRLPDNLGERIKFMEGRYRHESVRRYRNTLLYVCSLRLMPASEMMRLFNRSEATIYRWLKEMREDMREVWTKMDLADLHAEYMARDAVMEQMIFSRLAGTTVNGVNVAATPGVVADLIRTWTQKNKLRLSHLQRAGYYDVFTVKRGGERESEDAASRFQRRLSAFEVEEPLTIEHDDAGGDLDIEDWPTDALDGDTHE